ALSFLDLEEAQVVGRLGMNTPRHAQGSVGQGQRDCPGAGPDKKTKGGGSHCGWLASSTAASCRPEEKCAFYDSTRRRSGGFRSRAGAPAHARGAGRGAPLAQALCSGRCRSTSCCTTAGSARVEVSPRLS